MKQRISAFMMIIAFCFGVHILKVGCPIKFLTGISCAGCGMTRAWIYVLKLDFPRAFQFHPLFWTVPIGSAVYLFREHIPYKVVRFLANIGIILFVTVYIIRMINPEDTIVEINFYEGAVWKNIKRVRNL